MENAKLQQKASQTATPKTLSDFLTDPEIPDNSKVVVESTTTSPTASQFFHVVATP